MARTLGLCSWSLRPASPAELVERVIAAGCRDIQLHLDPIRTGAWDEAELVALLRESGIRVRSGMMTPEGEDYTSLESIRRTGGLRPDGTWDANLDAARDNAALAHRLGVPLITLHAGFIPHDEGDPERFAIIDRIGRCARVMNAEGVRLGLETGQESAATLASSLELLDDMLAGDAPTPGVNFDPANMILYGMGDPVAALSSLGPRVVQIHAKDALPSPVPGEWGEEVPVGAGAVDWAAFFAAADASAPGVSVFIEREAGEDRVGDIRIARERLLAWCGVAPDGDPA